MFRYNEYVTWEKLISIIKEKTFINYQPVYYHALHKGLSVDGKLPYSVTEAEFNFLKDFIIKNNLKYGFELATGICISTIALSIAFKHNNGLLVSLDSYFEENTQIIPGNIQQSVFNESKGFKNNNLILDSLELTSNTKLYLGVSPTDSIKIIENNFGTNTLDFVFLDCPKTSEDFERDLIYIKKYINKEKYAIFVHDTHCYPESFLFLTRKYFDVEPKLITNFEFENRKIEQYLPFALITNIL